MARLHRVNLAGEIYHVTQHGLDDTPLFRDDFEREAFLFKLSDEIARSEWTCLAYCLMRTHYHLLVRTQKPTLSSGFQRLNTRYAQVFNHRRERRGHVFEARFRDRIIESDHHRAEALRYIHLNPVRAGICDRPEEYEWSDYGATVGLYIGDFIVDTRAALEPFGANLKIARTNYRKFVAERDRRVRRGQTRAWRRRGTGQAPGLPPE
jgi:REP-associated tyrosine transposase